ncbi:hypothetical protein KY284_011514 [Solanum tuberosum]|nr:hypothetical protein KY284_011514 [Solanum tuberosum]
MANNDALFFERLMTAVRVHPVVILTGSIENGRIREIIQHLSGYARGSIVAYTRTRNVCSFAGDFANERDLDVGGVIGCTTLLGNRSGVTSEIRFFSDGFLLFEALDDRALRGYDVFVLDQVCERTLATDICIGYLKWLLYTRPEVRLVLMGVGNYVGVLRHYFANTTVISAGPPSLDLNSQKGPPLMKVANIASVCLLLMMLERSPLYFDYLDEPPKESLDKAKQNLLNLRAITEGWVITDLGRRLARLPLSPEMGNLLLTSSQYNCCPEMLTICSMMAVSGKFVNPTNDLLMDLFDYLVLLKLEAAFQKSAGTKLPSLLDDTGFSSMDSLVEALRAASEAKTMLSNILTGMEVEVVRTNDQQHPHISLTKALIEGKSNVNKNLVAGYAGLQETWPPNPFWSCEELP